MFRLLEGSRHQRYVGAQFHITSRRPGISRVLCKFSIQYSLSLSLSLFLSFIFFSSPFHYLYFCSLFSLLWLLSSSSSSSSASSFSCCCCTPVVILMKTYYIKMLPWLEGFGLAEDPRDISYATHNPVNTRTLTVVSMGVRRRCHFAGEKRWKGRRIIFVPYASPSRFQQRSHTRDGSMDE